MALIRVVVGIRVEWRFVYLPPGFAVSEAYCVDDPEDCCTGSGEAGSIETGSGGLVVVGCCDTPIPEVLCLTFGGSLYALGSVVLFYTGQGVWLGNTTPDDCGGGRQITFVCDEDSGMFGLGTSPADTQWQVILERPLTCNPFYWLGSGSATGICGGPFTASVVPWFLGCGGEAGSGGAGSGGGGGDVVTECCPSGLPATLYLSLTVTGDCAELTGTYQLDWDEAAEWWIFDDFVGGELLQIVFRCYVPSSRQFILTMDWGGDIVAGAFTNGCVLPFVMGSWNPSLGICPSDTFTGTITS